MLEFFLINKVIITSAIFLHNGNFRNLNLTDDEWKEISIFCDYLKSFFEFTVEMSGSNYSTLKTLLLLLNHLLDHIIITIDKSKISWIKEIVKEMKIKFDSIQEKLYHSSAYLALILDPWYKTQILPDNISENAIKNILIDEFNSYKNLNSENGINEGTSSVGEKRKALGIMDLMLQKK